MIDAHVHLFPDRLAQAIRRWFAQRGLELSLQPWGEGGWRAWVTAVDSSSGAVERQSATLANDSCVSWSGWSPVTLVGGADTSVVSGNCYRYRYEISDNVGNQSSPSSSSGTAKVDTSAPSAPTLAFSALTNAAASGQTVYFRPGVAGGFTVTADSSDAQSSIDFYAFPALGSGWSSNQSGATVKPCGNCWPR